MNGMRKILTWMAVCCFILSCSALPQALPEDSCAVIAGKTKAAGFGDYTTENDFVFGLSVHLGSQEPYSADYMWNTRVSAEGGIWKTDDVIYWMPGMQLRFYAYMPYVNPDVPNEFMTISSAGEVPEIQYIASVNAGQHIDIQVAEDIREKGVAELNFRHILACIRIVKGSEFSDNADIAEVRVSGIIGNGNYNMVSGTWRLGIGPGTFRSSGIAEPFMFPPQDIPDKSAAELEIIVNDQGRRIKGSIPLSGTRLEGGLLYTYTISYIAGRITAAATEPVIPGNTYYMDERSEDNTTENDNIP